jgi:ABC-type nickel/cobalt efflux system permease component RcnA
MSDWLVLGTACMLGALHALEVDHMLAVTTFVSRRPALRTAAGFGARWGIGHSVAVLAAGGVLIATGIRLPQRFDAIAEALVGLVLIGLGTWALVSVRKLHLHSAEEHGGHSHVHLHAASGELHDHPHRRPEDARGDHTHGSITLVGLLHGLAGTSGVVALVPVTMMGRPALGVGYLAAFGIGVTMAMTTFALVAAAAVRQATGRSLAWTRRVATAIGVTGVAVGLWWLGRALL